MQIEQFDVTSIRVGHRLRQVDPAKVDVLAASIAAIGLQTPITVQVMDLVDGDGVITEGVPVLVAGLHRLEASRKLGLGTIIATVCEGSDVDAKLWEIAENLHRADLSVQERADHVAEWIKLTNEKLCQDETVSRGGRGNQGGIRAAARDLGVGHTEAARAVKISSITPEARAAADEAGLNSQKARLEIASAEPDQQSAKVHELAERRVKPAPAIKNAFESEEDWRRALFNVWNRGAQEWREHALEVMDISPHVNTRFGHA